MNKFEEEFKNVEVEEFDGILDYLSCVKSRLNCSLTDLEYIDNELVEALKKDFKFKFASKAINKFSFLFGVYDEDMYDEDIRILNQHRTLVEKFSTCFKTLSDVINDDNCRDVLRLAIYAEIKYGDSHDYYLGKRNEYVLSCNGIYCDMNRDCDEDEFIAFFNRKIEEFKIINVLGVSKVKKPKESSTI